MKVDAPTDEELALLAEYQRRLAVRARATACTASLYEFFRASWVVLEPSAPFVDNWHIRAVCDAIQLVLEDWARTRSTAGFVQRINNLLINMPPGSAKSRIICVAAPCWFWIKHPEWRAIFFSGNPRIAARDSVYRRDLIESEWYRETFKPTWSLKQDQNAKLQFNNDRGGFLSALTAGQRVIGDRADCLFIDDPNDTDGLSDEVRIPLNEVWWDQGAANRVNDPITSVRIGVMQRLHMDDWAGHVLKEKDETTGRYVWEHLCFRQEYEPRKGCPCGRLVCELPVLGKLDPRTEPGELFFVARFPAHVLRAELTRLKAAGYAGQHQQQPYAEGGDQLKRTWFQFYTEDPDLICKSADEVFQSWDMSFKDTKRSDYVVGQVWAIKGPRRYLLDQVRDRMDFPATLKAVRRISKRWPKALAKYVEDKANGSGVIATLKAELEGLIPVNPAGGKEARASAVAPLIEAGDVYLPSLARAPWVESLLGECDAFPNGLHDDQVDAMTQALSKTVNRKYEDPKPDRRTEGQKIWAQVEEWDAFEREINGTEKRPDDWRYRDAAE